MVTSTVEDIGLAVVDGCRAGRFRMIEVDCGWVDVGASERRAGLFIRMLETDCDWVSVGEEGVRAGRFRLPEMGCDGAHG